MTWNVFRYDINKRQIVVYNIFNHGGFIKDISKFVNDSNKEEFTEKLKKCVMYYFWARCEYEVVISGWPPAHSDVDKKVDIYEQLMLNWYAFVDYVWEHVKRIEGQ